MRSAEQTISYCENGPPAFVGPRKVIVQRPIIRRPWPSNVISYRTAIFRQVNKDKAYTHHDALEFPDGKLVLLTTLKPGQQATVLQLPAEPQRAQEKPAANTGPKR